MNSSTSYRWIPLESNPLIFNDYFHHLGLSESFFFEELFSFEYKEVQNINIYNVQAVIINFLKIVPNDKIYLSDNFDNNPNLFYMLQTDPLTNACGVVAGLHAIGNIDKSLNPLQQKSIIEEFIKNSTTPSNYAESLSNNEKWKKFHLKMASKGTSEVPPNMEDVKHHYVAFIIKDKKLYELDGRLNKPYFHKEKGEVNKEDLLDKVIEIVKKRLAQKEMDDIFSMMFLEKK